MPRIRTIKPEFCTSEQVVECSTSARLLFVTMWCFCDDAGRHPASVRRVKMECLPGDPFTLDEVQGFIDELKTAELLVEYEHEGKRFWQVTGWFHQRIDRPNYKYGPFDDAGKPSEIQRVVDERSTSPRRTTDESSPPDRKGREGKGKEGIYGRSPKSRRKTEYTEEFEAFWEAFPPRRRTKKVETFKRWKEALAAGQAPERLIQRAKDYADSEEARGQYCKGPSPWLNQGCWDDSPEAWANSDGTPSPRGGKIKMDENLKSEMARAKAMREARKQETNR